MNISKTWINLSLALSILLTIVSAAGILIPKIYSQEHPSWGAQGFGQDIVTLFLVVPALLVSIYKTRKGSRGAFLVLLGLLVYISYSYVLYSLFMHFTPIFLLYVATLGLSFYNLIGLLLEVKDQKVFESNAFKGSSIYLIVNGILFGLLWLMELIPSSIKGIVPKSASDVGFWVNPVHVLDLAFIIPAMLIAGFYLWKGKSIGQLLAVPIMIFAITMGTAIVSMIWMLNLRGVSDSYGPMVLMVINVLLGIYFSSTYIRNIKDDKEN